MGSLDMLDPITDSALLQFATGQIMFVDKVNHLRLFPQCACVAAHAGAGTSACMFRSGKPCVVTPVWGDQNFMGDRFESLGCGLRGPHFSKVTSDNLEPLISRVLQEPSFLANAARVRESILSRRGGNLAIAEELHELIQDGRSSKRSFVQKDSDMQ